MQLKIERFEDARAIAEAFAKLYPSYTFNAVKPKRAKLWRIASKCRVTGVFLQYAQI